MPEVKIIISAEDKASHAFQSIGNLSQTTGTAVIAGLAGVGVAIGAISSALLKFTYDAAKLSGVQAAFESLTSSIEGGSQAMLQAMQEASGGMIDMGSLMMSFNQAAQIVSVTFAQQLPEAMTYLSKVAAATGQDMSFLLSSLVTGVGKLSPIILDNLSIQVDLNAAYEEYAASIGKSVDELTKEEMQTALMNQVLEKLRQNTAMMPSVNESFYASIQRIKASLKDASVSIGKAFLPAVSELARVLEPIAEHLIASAVGWFQRLEPIIREVAAAIADFIEKLFGGEEPLIAFKEAFSGLIPQKTIDGIASLYEGIKSLFDAIQPYVEMIANFIQKHVELSDVLIALGIVILSVVIFAIKSLITTIAPMALLIMAIIGAVALLRNAWENNWGGIQEKTAAVMQFIQQIVSSVLTWATQFWQEHGEQIKSAISNAISFAQSVINGIVSFVQAIVSTLTELWKKYGDDVIAVFKFFQEQIRTLFEAFSAAFKGDWHTFGEKLRELWDNALNALIQVARLSWDKLKELFRLGMNAIREIDWIGLGKAIVQGIINGIKSMGSALVNAIISVVKAAVEAAEGFLGIESPSRLFKWIGEMIDLGLSKGIELHGELPSVAMRSVLSGVVTSSMPQNPLVPGNFGGEVGTINHVNITINAEVSNDLDIEQLANKIGRVMVKVL